MSKTVPWPRIMAEGIVIVVSVLLALAADAWWDGRVDRAEEVRRLAAVRLELEEARESYGGLLETITERSERIAEVLADSTGFAGRESRLDSLLFRLGPLTDPTPATVALDDAVSGGVLGLITSAEIRLSLGRYGTAVERLRGEAETIRERFESELPFVYEYVNLRRQMATSPSVAFDVGLPDVPMEPLYGEMLSERRYLNQMVGHAALLARLRLRTEEALQALEQLLELLDDRLG